MKSPRQAKHRGRSSPHTVCVQCPRRSVNMSTDAGTKFFTISTMFRRLLCYFEKSSVAACAAYVGHGDRVHFYRSHVKFLPADLDDVSWWREPTGQRSKLNIGYKWALVRHANARLHHHHQHPSSTSSSSSSLTIVPRAREYGVHKC